MFYTHLTICHKNIAYLETIFFSNVLHLYLTEDEVETGGYYYLIYTVI